jgi:hypothetical protein
MVLFVAAVSFFWVTTLSAISASDSKESTMIPIPVSADPVPIYGDSKRNVVIAVRHRYGMGRFRAVHIQ